MKDATQLTQPQRKALIDMLTMGYSGEIWSRAKKKYDELRSSLYDSFVREIAEKSQGTKQLIDAVHRLRAEVRKSEVDLHDAKVDLAGAEEKLKAVGFEVSESEETLSLSYECPDSLKQSIEKRVNAELGTREKVLTIPFETARLKLLTVATSEEAEKIVEPLLNFEVTVK